MTEPEAELAVFEECIESVDEVKDVEATAKAEENGCNVQTYEAAVESDVRPVELKSLLYEKYTEQRGSECGCETLLFNAKAVEDGSVSIAVVAR